jgi:hypothetical protein
LDIELAKTALPMRVAVAAHDAEAHPERRARERAIDDERVIT